MFGDVVLDLPFEGQKIRIETFGQTKRDCLANVDR